MLRASYIYTMPVQPDDIAVIHLVLQGQQAAYAAIVDKYQQYVFTLVMRYVNNRVVAEELSQDVFVKAYRYLADFKGNSKFSTWLYTIVNTTCISHLRKKNNGAVLLDEQKMIGIADSQMSEKPYQQMEQESTKQMLERALQYLDEQDNLIISLYYQAEQSVEEIGASLGLSASNVKVRLFRARGKLKQILETKFAQEING